MKEDSDGSAAVELFLYESRRTLTEQVRYTEQLSSKAFETIKINLLIMGFIIGAFRIIEQSSNLSHSILVSGIPLTLSTMVAIVAWIRINPTRGARVGKVDLPLYIRSERTQEELINAYTDWTEQNLKQNIWNRRLLIFSLGLTASSITIVAFEVAGFGFI